jgi:hypothetical protein
MPLDLATVLAKLDRGARLSTGVVTGLPGGRQVALSIGGPTLTITRAVAYTTPAIGDVVLILTTPVGTSYAVCALATGTSPVPPDPPHPPPTTGTMTFTALSALTYRTGGIRTDRTGVMSGDDGAGLNQGAWFYGTAPAATLTGATITNARIYCDRRTGGPDGGIAISAYLHNTPTATAAPPPITAGPTVIGTLAVGDSAWLDIPVTWAQQIIAGTARGLGIYKGGSAPFVALASLEQTSQTGAISLDWQKG